MSQNLLTWAEGIEKRAAVVKEIKNGIEWGSRKSFPKFKGREVPKVHNPGKGRSYGGYQPGISTFLQAQKMKDNASVPKFNNILADTNLKNDLSGRSNGLKESLPEKKVGYFSNIWKGVKQEVGDWQPKIQGIWWQSPNQAAAYIPSSVQRQIQFHGYRNIDEVPNYIFHQIEHAKDPISRLYYNFKKLDEFTYPLLVDDIREAATISPKLAGAIYRRLLRNGADPKILTSMLKKTSYGPEINITQPIYAAPKYTMTDRLKQFGDQAMLTSLSIPGRTIRSIRNMDDAASDLGNDIALNLFSKIKKNEKYYGDDKVLTSLKDAIVKDTDSTIKEFGTAPIINQAYINLKDPSIMHLGESAALSPSTIAHEYGHTKLTKWWEKLLSTMRVKANMNTTFIKQLFLSAPEEIRASLEGFLLLRRQGLPIKESLRAFSGVPSYMLPGIMQLLYRTGIIGGAVGAGYGVYKAIAPENK